MLGVIAGIHFVENAVDNYCDENPWFCDTSIYPTKSRDTIFRELQQSVTDTSVWKLNIKDQLLLLCGDIELNPGPVTEEGEARILNAISECFIHSIHHILPLLSNLFNRIFITGVYPNQWCEAVIIPIFKKGDTNSTDNYRGISLLNVVSVDGHYGPDKLC
ncbi:hypothetical protein MAR_034280 [Mya arenaria]|uniref:Uncharacterized protein n=1 Tax=Mya arenaria TaxID=6604 RepID=A0ABY7GBG8_MYAAR|nr:hypothetical protein MAR_034280 [Mya arenaria]